MKRNIGVNAVTTEKCSVPDSFNAKVVLRCPFVFGKVPALLRFRRFALRIGFKPLRNLSKFLLKIPYRWLRLPLSGTFGIEFDGDVRWINVSTENWQLETVLTWPRGNFEPSVVAMVDFFLSDDGVFYDIGANWGYYTFHVASRPGFNGSIHSFEPFPQTVSELESVLTQTGFGECVTVHRIALSDREGVAQMAAPHRVKSAMARIEDGLGGITVVRKRLDAIQIPGPDLIKLDVEGHEVEVLRGAETLLRVNRPVIVFENLLVPEQIEKSLTVIRYLAGIGYQVFAPVFDGSFTSGRGQLTFTPITAETRTEFPELRDLCAIQCDRVAEVLLSPSA